MRKVESVAQIVPKPETSVLNMCEKSPNLNNYTPLS